jgi:hypothetical protein
VTSSNTPSDPSDRARTVAAIFMTMLVAWNTAEFALQPERRPPQTEILVLIATCAVLVVIPFIHSRTRWAAWTAFIVSLGQCLFGLLGVWGSPLDQGFGKVGPGVAAVLTAVVVYYSARLLWRR